MLVFYVVKMYLLESAVAPCSIVKPIRYQKS